MRNRVLRDIHLKELFQGGSIALGFKLFSVVLTYVFFYVIARYYGASGLGVFNTCFTALILGSVIAKLGLDTALVKYIAEFVAKDKISGTINLYNVSLVLILVSGFIIGLVFYIFSDYLSLLFFENLSYNLFFKIVGFTVIPYSIFQLNSEYFRGFKRISAHSAFQNGTIYFTILIFIFLLSQNRTNVNEVIYFLLTSVILLVVISIAIIFRNNYLLKKGNATNKVDLKINKKKLLSVSIPMFLSNSLFLVMSWTDTLMLSAFNGEDAVGIYNVALKIASLNTIALIAINAIASPKFSEIYSTEGSRRFRRIVHQTTLLNAMISLPVFIMILLFPVSILSIFGEEFIVGQKALILLSVGQLVSAISGSTMIVLNMTGKEKAGRNILLITTIINIVLNYVLIPRFGFVGAAIATMSSTIFWNVVTVIFIYRNYGFLTFPLNFKTI